MNRDQVKYVKERISDIFNVKKREIDSRLQEIPKDLNLDAQEKLDLIKQGKAKRRPWNEIQPYTDFVYAYTYPQDVEIDKIKKANDTFKKRNLSKLETLRNSLMDTLMLGDTDIAYTLLNELENFKIV